MESKTKTNQIYRAFIVLATVDDRAVVVEEEINALERGPGKIWPTSTINKERAQKAKEQNYEVSHSR